MANLINITDADLKKSAVTYRKDLLLMPVISANHTLQHMTARPGVAGREVVGELSGDVQFGPYNASRVDDSDLTVTARTLETFLGSVVKKFDPNSVAKTVYGELQAQGQALTSAAVTRAVAMYIAGKLGKSLNKVIFSAKRKDSGTTTADLFDGFDTITDKEITATNIAANKGNFKQLDAAVTTANAVDTLMGIYDAASDELKMGETKMFLPSDIYNAYCRDYLNTFGAVAYNQQYKKTTLEGSDGRCELVPLISKAGSKFIHLTTKSNMLFGYGSGLADENVEIEKYDPFLVSYVATMYFGTQFESISPEALFVAKLAA